MRKPIWRSLMAFVLILGLLVTLGGCGSQNAAGSADVIKVGIILPLTGSEATFGNMEKNAFEMAYEELKAAGKTTIGGKDIQLLFEDDQGKQDMAKSATEKLVNQDKVVMISGAYSSASTNVIAGAAQSMNIPLLVTTGSADDITKKGWEWVFRGAAAPASKYTVALWEMLDQVIKPKTAAIIYESTDFGKSSATGFRAEAEKRGIEIVYDQPYEAGAIDFKPMLAKVKTTNPDMVFAVSYLMDASMIVKQSKELDFNTKLVVGGGAGYTLPEFRENAGEASEYIASSTLWVPSVTWPGAKEFFDNYVKKYGKEPDYHGAQAYATMHIIVDALNRAQELSNTGIQKALKETDLMTVMGPIKFEDWEGYTNQNRPYTYVVQWQKGKLEVIWPEDVKSAPLVYPVPNWGER
ncbi:MULTISPECIES: ABC transporter substrate-binding protein [Desulfitobacterium]|uniref:Amino acid/amide ABC transporter substrate-binding protein, HAAT family n=1 Tax=Desulfitobacterium dehalogenans (strain ATCC 51507 / DSM 9161 / JW/IU-DC1) TaxID=756499 RepID=I4ACN5_DESDJ|nr:MULTISPECIES: ABC transporter substrate-binding protein [Desulfitobacterium]AFM01720.1 amino acid/amide ABC transporter substrate-binding protein, HAAT family [Desulfitobacterium dehalogenans ATCC 51507]